MGRTRRGGTPLRETLTNEIHARPPTTLVAPCRVSHLALLSGETAASRDRDHVGDLCRRFGAAEPPKGSNYWHVDLGVFRLNWERHTEFSTYTFICRESFAEAFRDCVISRVPADWLAGLAAEIERLAATGNYRFSAARAYYALVQRRITELREQRLDGRAPFHEFMERRLAPAMRTCESVEQRLNVLSERIARAANLLRTRVDVALEQQSRDLLDSMNRRASLQLRLQETVEVLSVVVLSYYLVGLVNYLLKSLDAAGMRLDPTLWTGLILPMIVATVWLGTRRARRWAQKREE